MAEAGAPSDFLTLLYLTHHFQLISLYALASQFPSAVSTTMNVLCLRECTILATTSHQVMERDFPKPLAGKVVCLTSQARMCLTSQARMNVSVNTWLQRIV